MTKYALTGVFKKDGKYSVGNPTYFSLPESFKDHLHTEDNMFSSLDQTMMMDMSSLGGEQVSNSDDFVENMLDVFKEKIDQMKEKICKKLIVCYYKVGRVSL